MRCLIMLSIALIAATTLRAAERADAPGLTTNPKPLDLRLGDVRRYLSAEEYRALIGAPALDANAVIVKADAPLVPMKFEQPVPGGLASLWFAVKNPTQLWRIFVPDPAQGEIGPPDSKVPPREFRWGP